MKKTSHTSPLFVPGTRALAGAAQAETFDSPQQAGEASTMTGGAPNALTTHSPDSDHTVVVETRVLGAGPAVVTTDCTTTEGPTSDYSVPSTVVEPAGHDTRNRRRSTSFTSGRRPLNVWVMASATMASSGTTVSRRTSR